MKINVLMPTRFYEPAFKAGGPVRSIGNLVHALDGSVNFIVIAGDTDLDGGRLKNIYTNKWYSNPRRIYLSPRSVLRTLQTFLKEAEKCETLYLNSLFSILYSFLPLLLVRLKVVHFKRIVLAPRGQLLSQARDSKSIRKKIYLYAAKKMGLFQLCTIHATSEDDRKSILELGATDLMVIPNIAALSYITREVKCRKLEGTLKCAFVGRINRHKNLLYALKAIRDASLSGVNIVLDVYGVAQDVEYFNECSTFVALNRLSINFFGALEHHDLMNSLQEYDLMFLPTLSENFGHSIAEALISGVPVLISDETPFKDLMTCKVGHCWPLSEEKRFVDSLIYFSNLSLAELYTMKLACKRYIKERLQVSRYMQSYKKLLGV